MAGEARNLRLPITPETDVGDYYSRFTGPITIPPQLQQQAPIMSAPQQTAAESFREGTEDFGTRATGAALMGFDDEIAGALAAAGGGSYQGGRDAQRQRQRAADERSPRAALGGDIFGGMLSPFPGGTLGKEMAGNVVNAVGSTEASITPGSLPGLLRDVAAGVAVGRAAKMPAGLSGDARSKWVMEQLDAARRKAHVSRTPPSASPPKKMGIHTVPPEQLADVTSWEIPLSHDHPQIASEPVRMDRMRQLFDRGPDAVTQLRPPIVVVSPKGRMEVEDGRHRILVARERGEPLKVKFVRGSKAMDEPIPGEP